jgi:hypothetical protein
MTLVADIRQRILDKVAALDGRVDQVADLAELVRRNALPQKSPAAFCVPAGFDGGEPDAATGIYRQAWNETVGVVLYVEAPGDARASRAIDKVDELVAAIVGAVAGWAPADAIGVIAAVRGRLVSVDHGAVLYQIDFALSDQLRITPS